MLAIISYFQVIRSLFDQKILLILWPLIVSLSTHPLETKIISLMNNYFQGAKSQTTSVTVSKDVKNDTTESQTIANGVSDALSHEITESATPTRPLLNDLTPETRNTSTTENWVSKTSKYNTTKSVMKNTDSLITTTTKGSTATNDKGW